MPTWLKSMMAGLALMLATAVHAEIAVPAAGTRVTDLTQTLSVDETETLARELERIDEQTGARVLVLMVPTLDGEPIEDFAQRVFDTWKPGRKGVDDGVLLVLAKHERKIRIATGRGLEGALPDLAAKRITQTSMAPAFKQDRFADGFMAAARDIETLVRAEKLPASVQPDGSNRLVLVVAGFLALLAGAWFLSSRYARRQAERRARVDAAAQEALTAAREREQRRPRTWAEPYLAAQPAGARAVPRVTPSSARRTTSTPAASSVRRDDDPAPVVTGYYVSSGGSSGSDNDTRTSSNDYVATSNDGTSAGGGASDTY